MNELRNIERVETIENWIFAACVTFVLIGGGLFGYSQNLEPLWGVRHFQDPVFVDENYPPMPRRPREVSPSIHREAVHARWFAVGFLTFAFVGYVVLTNKVVEKWQRKLAELKFKRRGIGR